MPKTPKFIVDMKSHPRSPKHGNRKSSPPAHGDPVDGAGTRNDRADAFAYAVSVVRSKPVRTSLPAVTWRTLYAGVPITRVATIPTMPFPDPGVVADHLKQMQEAMIQQMQKLMHWSNFDLISPKPPEIPHAGIRAGEIIGWRVWWINYDGRLRSFVRDEIFWEPGEAMTGDINKCIHISFRGLDRFGGVYCFNDLGAAMHEYYSTASEIKLGNSHPNPALVGLVVGTVKLWGEVVEHEGGYRASFAKPNEFLQTYYWGKRPSRDPYELYFGPRPAIDSSRWTG